MHIFTRTLLSVSLCASPWVFSGCSRGAEQPPTKAAAQSSVLGKVPPTTFGFLVYDESSSGAGKLRKSPWGGTGGLEQSLAQIDDEHAKKAMRLVQTLQKIGLASSGGDQEPAVKEGVWFVGGDLLAAPELGIFLEASKNVNMEEKLTALEAALKAENAALKPETVAGAKAFSVDLGTSEGGVKLPRFYFAANKEFFAATSQPGTAARLFDVNVRDGAKHLLESPGFVTASKRVDDTKDQFAYGYLDAKSLLEQVRKLAEAGVASDLVPTPAPGAPAVTPEEQKENLKQIINEIPVDSVFGSSKMDDSLSYQILFHVQPKSDQQKMAFGALEGTEGGHIVGKAPAGSVFLLSVDGKVLRTARDALLASVPQEGRAEAGSALAVLDTIQNLGIVVRGNAAGSPFPDVVLLATSTKSAETEQSLRQLVGMGLTATGMPLSPWQTKDIEGSSLNFTSTPLGVGVYMVETKGTVVMASSELAARDVIKTLKDGESLETKLEGGIRAVLKNSSGPLVYYANMAEAARLLESIQGSLAMFTGSSAAIDRAQVERLKSLGKTLGTVRFKDGLLEVTQAYHP